mgnify:CR=1 FL=1
MGTDRCATTMPNLDAAQANPSGVDPTLSTPDEQQGATCCFDGVTTRERRDFIFLTPNIKAESVIVNHEETDFSKHLPIIAEIIPSLGNATATATPASREL